MIIRLRGPFENVLMLTPVVREMKLRGLEVNIETEYREIFYGSPYVDCVDVFIMGDEVIDLTNLQLDGRHLIEQYAEAVLGDSRLSSWSVEMFCGHESGYLVKEIGDGKPVLACAFGNRLTKANQVEMERFVELMEMDYSVFVLGEHPVEAAKVSMCWRDLDFVYDMIRCSDLFFGLDCIESFVAMATKTPMVVAGSMRDWNRWHPFRRGIPFESVDGKCERRLECWDENVVIEHGTLQFVDCEDFVCGKSHCAEHWKEVVDGLG